MNVQLKNLIGHSFLRRAFILITPAFCCFACLPGAQAAPGKTPAAPETALTGDNTADGDHALFSLTTGVANVANGWYSLFSNTDGSYNTAVGAGTLVFNIGDQGAQEGIENTAVGAAALLFNTTGAFNTATGGESLFSNTEGGANTASGFGALFSNTGGNNNTATGYEALRGNASGDANTATGDRAGQDITGNSNICIGARVTGVAGENNTIRIGDNLPDTQGDSACYIGGIYNQLGDPASTVPVGIDATGKLTAAASMPSSRRFKHDVKPMDQTSENILALKPVTFHYKSDKKNTPCFGLIAEEVAQVNPDLVVRNKKGEIWAVRYDAINAMLLNEFLKEHRKVEMQQSKIEN